MMELTPSLALIFAFERYIKHLENIRHVVLHSHANLIDDLGNTAKQHIIYCNVSSEVLLS